MSVHIRPGQGALPFTGLKRSSAAQLAGGTLWQKAMGLISSQMTEVLCVILTDARNRFQIAAHSLSPLG